MIGLEYILHTNNVSSTDLAENLGIAKQNISRWFSGERKIPNKYLETLAEMFKVDIELFQKDIGDTNNLHLITDKSKVILELLYIFNNDNYKKLTKQEKLILLNCEINRVNRGDKV
jgi:transcriptional regulator with XRE-family HTH domain